MYIVGTAGQDVNEFDLGIIINGNVGIGTTAPDNLLHISATDTGGLTLAVSNNSGSRAAKLSFKQTNATVIEKAYIEYFAQTIGADETRGNSLEIATESISNAFISFRPNDAEAMRIATSGNVGIGNTIPNSTLQVSGNIMVADGPANNITFGTGSDVSMYFDGTSFIIKGG